MKAIWTNGLDVKTIDRERDNQRNQSFINWDFWRELEQAEQKLAIFKDNNLFAPFASAGSLKMLKYYNANIKHA